MADQKISQLTASTTPLAGTEVLPIVQGGATKKVSVANLTADRAVEMGSTTIGGAGFLDGVYLGLGNTNPSAFAGGRLILGNYSDTSASLNGLQLASNKAILTAFADGATDGNGATIAVGWANGGQGPLNLAIGATTTLQMRANGDVAVSTGNLVIGTAGKGIDFSADGQAAGMTSELLDDYEEGTWTPSITSSSGTITTVGAVSGYYTKVGRKVTVWASVAITDNGTGAGAILFSGLPFASQDTIRSAGAGWNESSAKMLSAYVNSGLSAGACWYYDATYPVTTGQSFVFCVSYNV